MDIETYYTTSTRPKTKTSSVPRTLTIPALIYCEKEKVVCREEHLTPYCNLTLVDLNGKQLKYCNKFVPVKSSLSSTTTTTMTNIHMSMTMKTNSDRIIPTTITATSKISTTIETSLELETSSEMETTTTTSTTSNTSESIPCQGLITENLTEIKIF